MSSETGTYIVHFAREFTEQLRLTPLDSGHYRAEESSLLNDSINLGDELTAKLIGEGEISFLHVSQKSPYVTLRWLISETVIKSDGLDRFLEQVTGAGGLWERALGGLLILHLPRESAFDAEREFTRQTDLEIG
jgi:hypothetical protein